jgi:hypothetical protein
MRRLLTQLRYFRPGRRLTGAIVGVTLVVGAFGGGAAYAYWRSSGAGSGVASVGAQPADVHLVNVAGTPTSTLVPGGTGALQLSFNNPNAYSVTMVAISSAAVQNPGGGCTAANSGVTVPNQSGLHTTISPTTPGSPVTVTIAGAVSMDTSSVSACQGKTFQIALTVTVQR